LKEPKRDIEDHEEIKANKENLEQISEIIDECNNYPTVKNYRLSHYYFILFKNFKRRRFAFKTFLKQAIPYTIWIIFLAVVALGQTTTNDSPKSFFFTNNVQGKFLL
jgi:hypothetical protein